MDFIDILTRISDKTLKDIVRFSLKSNRSGFNLLYNKSTGKFLHGFRGITSVPENLFINQLIKDSKYITDVASAILENWFTNNQKLRERIKESLIGLNYDTRDPDFSKKRISFMNLKKKDIKQKGGFTFFAPQGKLLKDIDPSESTIMALLFGWFYDEKKIPKEKSIETETSIESNNPMTKIEKLYKRYKNDYALLVQKEKDLAKKIANTEIIENIELESQIEKTNKSQMIAFKEIARLHLELFNEKIEYNEVSFIKEIQSIFDKFNETLEKLNEIGATIKEYKSIITLSKALIPKQSKSSDSLIKFHKSNKIIEDKIDNKEIDNINIAISTIQSILDFVSGKKNQIKKSKYTAIISQYGSDFFAELMQENFIIQKSKNAKAQDNSPKRRTDNIQEDIEDEAVDDTPEENKDIVEKGAPEDTKIKEEDDTKEDIEDEAEDDTPEENKDIVEKSVPNDTKIKEEDDTQEETDVKQFSMKILEENTIPNINTINRYIWHLIFENKYAIAYHLAVYFEKSKNVISKKVIPSWLIECILLSRDLKYNNEIIFKRIENIFDITDNADILFEYPDFEKSKAIILGSILIKPALLYLSNDILNQLKTLHFPNEVGGLYELNQKVIEFSKCGYVLNSDYFVDIDYETKNIKDKTKLINDVKKWKNEAQKIRLKYPPAHKVFHKWLHSNQLIGKILDKIIDFSDFDLLNNFIKEYSQNNDMLIEIANATFRKMNKGKPNNPFTKGKSIQMINHFKPIVEFAIQAQEIHKKTYNKSEDFVRQSMKDIWENIKNFTPTILEQLENQLNSSEDIEVKASCKIAKKVILDLDTLFLNNAIHQSDNPLDLQYISDLLKGTFTIDSEYKIDYYDADFFTKLIKLSVDETSWKEAYKYHSDNRNHFATNCILSILSNDKMSNQLEKLELERIKDIEQCRSALKRDLDDADISIEKEILSGLLSEDIRSELKAKLKKIENKLSSVLNFQIEHEKIENIKNDLLKRKKKKKSEFLKRLKKIGKEKQNIVAIRRIEQLICDFKFITALEYMDKLEQDLPLPEKSNIQNPFKEFFPEKLNALNDQIYAKKSKSLIRAIEEKKENEILNFDNIDSETAIQNAEAIKEFNALKLDRSIDKVTIGLILIFLGFDVGNVKETISLKKYNGYTLISLKQDKIDNRTICPSPRYGSQANGNYTFVLTSKKFQPDLYLSSFKNEEQVDSHIVLYTGYLSEAERRELSAFCKEKKKSFLVIDYPLMLFLCSKLNKMYSMFVCTLPFSYSEPYSITASYVPPEIFYGRIKEKREIINPSGKNFIYGGRQLGKTALLKEVQREFHNPAKGKISVWIDLKDSQENPDSIWVILIKEFRKVNILPSSFKITSDKHKFSDAVIEWINSDSRRRILLLLDEADNYFKIEQTNGFINTELLKNIMDNTNRRFKLVFSGLHNVQRMTKLANHPLAHLSTICIGPLIDNSEFQQARNLIEEPFASIGYEFESPDLIVRILAQTNYFPNLIQLYCYYLIQYVGERIDNEDECPPYKITEKHVEGVYFKKDTQLVKDIRNRLMWTLQLDIRYKLLAYVMANNYYNTGHLSMSVSIIRSEFLVYWPEGSKAESDNEIIRTLLDEMIGLGILKSLDNDKFAFRNLNVINTLGSKEQIIDFLCDEIENLPSYDATQFRPSLKSDLQVLRQVFTNSQITTFLSRVNKTSIIFGNKLTNIGNCFESLKLNFNVFKIERFSNIENFELFRNKMVDFEKSSIESFNCIVVDNTNKWDIEWIRFSENLIAKSKRKNNYLKPIFIADYANTWNLLDEDSDIEWIFENINVVKLAPFHDNFLSIWIDECNFGLLHNKKNREMLKRITGNWPAILYKLPELSKKKAISESNLKSLNFDEGDIEGENKFFDELGITGDLKVILECIAGVSPLSLDELYMFSEDLNVDKSLLKRVFSWAKLMSLVYLADDDRFDVNCLIKSLLIDSNE